MVCDDLTAGRRQNRLQATTVRSGRDIVCKEGREIVRAGPGPGRIVLPIGAVVRAMIVALIDATAKSCPAPSVEHRGSWIIDLHALHDTRATRSLPAGRTGIQRLGPVDPPCGDLHR